MRKLLVGLAIAVLVALIASGARASPVTEESASADVNLMVEKYLSIEITTAPHVTVFAGSPLTGGGYVGFKVKFNFAPCFYIHQYELADGMPSDWELYPGDYDVDTLDVDGDGNTTEKVGTNTFDNLTGMKYFPNGMSLGSGVKLDGVDFEDVAGDWGVIGTCYLTFLEGTGPYGD